jgi:hypothetical protein
MRINYNRTTGETKTLGKKTENPFDVNDLLIETRLCGKLATFKWGQAFGGKCRIYQRIPSVSFSSICVLE